MKELVYQSKKGNAITNSLNVAIKFEKSHKVVLKAIDNLIASLKERIGRHKIMPTYKQVQRAKKALESFAETSYLDSQGKKQRMYAMTKHGFTVLVQKLSGDKALDFQLEFIEAFEKMELKLKELSLIVNPLTLSQHTKREVQVANSKAINSTIWQNGGNSTDIADYNRDHCEKITGKTPSQLKKEAKEAKIPSKNRQSGKDVVRYLQPEKACRMSVDDMFCRQGVSLEDALEITEPLEKFFSKMIERGIKPAELTQ